MTTTAAVFDLDPEEQYRGIRLTRYWYERWRPTLGLEAAAIVEALRFLADRETGATFASQELIAKTAGLSLRQARRWLARRPPSSWDERRREQHRLLHTYFLVHTERRYRTRGDGLAVRTTNEYHVRMSEPLHPDDADRAAGQAELAPIPVQQATMGDGEPRAATDRLDPENRRLGRNPHTGPVGRADRVTFDRITLGNVDQDQSPEGGQGDPGYREAKHRLDRGELEQRLRMAAEIGDRLKAMDGDRSPDPHHSEGFLKRVAVLAGGGLLHQAFAATRDALDSGRLKGSPSAYFGGTVKNLAEENGIDLRLQRRRRAR